jgi:hypothetical protein
MIFIICADVGAKAPKKGIDAPCPNNHRLALYEAWKEHDPYSKARIDGGQQHHMRTQAQQDDQRILHAGLLYSKQNLFSSIQLIRD